MCVVYDHLDHAEDCFVMRIVEVIQFRVLTVKSEGVLGQVVGSDTEEINHLSKLVADDRCCRSLDHDSLFRKFVLDLLLFELCFYFCYDLIDLLYFLCGSDHRIHDGKISINSGTKKCTELCLKDIRLCQADTDRTISQSRVILVSEVEVIYLFVSTDIKGTDDNFLAGHHLYCLFVSLELLFLCREVISSKVKEFASEKTDSAGIILKNITDVTNTSDVRVDVDLVSI